MLREIPLIDLSDPLWQSYLGLPAQGLDSADIHQFPRRAVRFGTVPEHLSLETDNSLYQLREFADGKVLPHPDVDEVFPVIAIHQMETGAGAVVHVEKFAPGRATAPEDDLRLLDRARNEGQGMGTGQADVGKDVVGNWSVPSFVLVDGFEIAGGGELGEVEFADQGRENVGIFQVEVVAGAIEIGGHGGNEVAAVLAAIGLAQFDACYLGDGVPLIGRLQGASEEIVFLEGLGGQFGVDAGATETQQFFHAALESAVDKVGLDHEVVVEKLGRVMVVGPDAADLGGSDDDIIGTVVTIELVHRLLIAQVQLLAGPKNQIVKASAVEFTDDGGANQATVTGDVYFRLPPHVFLFMMVIDTVSPASAQFVALGQFQVFGHHFPHQLGERHLWRPSQLFPRLGGVPQ